MRMCADAPIADPMKVNFLAPYNAKSPGSGIPRLSTERHESMTSRVDSV